MTQPTGVIGSKLHGKQEKRKEVTQETRRTGRRNTGNKSNRGRDKGKSKYQEERNTENKEPESSYAVRMIWKGGKFCRKIFILGNLDKLAQKIRCTKKWLLCNWKRVLANVVYIILHCNQLHMYLPHVRTYYSIYHTTEISWENL
jgi:hypothetical protein